jgi:alpha,alpha-trehalase
VSAGGARDGYSPISYYAFLSDTHTAALVGPDASVEWFCAPRFDGGSVFARILDRERGGAFGLWVEGAGEPARRYLGDTLVLESRFEAPTGVATAFDFLAVSFGTAVDELPARHLLVRLVRCESGFVRVRAGVNARPGYAAREADWSGENGEEVNLWRMANPDVWLSSAAPLERDGRGLSAGPRG